jgi:hypothetical protein
MNQNSFCTKCHRIPSQCVCGGTFCELTNEEIMEVANEVFNTYKNWGYYQIDFARAILAKACEK